MQPDARSDVRSRSYTWDDPMLTADAARGRTGLELMQALAAGELPAPPITHTLGFELSSVEAGRAVFALDPGEQHYNPIGSVHGGVYATLLDSACGCAVHTMLPEGVGYTSLDLAVKFLGTIRTDTGRVTCTGTVTHFGRRSALAEARLEDGTGRLLATATSSCLILQP
ncbi:MAG: PaaI family thioesterase [Nocardioidaceae bacterium]